MGVKRILVQHARLTFTYIMNVRMWDYLYTHPPIDSGSAYYDNLSPSFVTDDGVHAAADIQRDARAAS